MIILDRMSLRDYLQATLDDDDIELPADISIDELTDDFMEYLEVDIYEWLRDNYRAYFRDLDWNSVSHRPT